MYWKTLFFIDGKILTYYTEASNLHLLPQQPRKLNFERIRDELGFHKQLDVCDYIKKKYGERF